MHIRQDAAEPAQPQHTAPNNLIEAIEEAIDALDFYAGPNCWGDPNVAQRTADKLRALVAETEPRSRNREVLSVVRTIEQLRRHNGQVLAAMREEADAHANWAPLEKICPPGMCEQFMFMGETGGIYRYKHVDSRRYLNVDVWGATYAYKPSTNSYDRVSLAAARQALVQP
jgi:hypothetical protein